jgi:hypothetical protein
MKKQPDQIIDIEEIAERAQDGEDVSGYFTGQQVTKQLVTIDFPLELLKLIDAECRLLGISREAWIKIACRDKLRLSHAPLPAVKIAA